MSTKDLAKAINAFLQSPTLPLPDDLNAVIEGYLGKHEKYDEAAADRLNNEMLVIYQKNVQDRPNRLAPFLATQRPLKTALSPVHLLQWWDRLAEPILEHMHREKELAKETHASTLTLLNFESDGGSSADEMTSHPFAERLMERWMSFSQIRQSENPPDSQTRERMIQTLVLYGTKRPQSFMIAVNSSLVKRECRGRALTILCELLSRQPPHLHLVLQTPLFGNILQSLQKDTSTTIVTLALSALIMLLPNMPSSLVPFLPSLFNIYARLLFWDKEKAFVPDGPDYDAETHNGTNGANGINGNGNLWEKCIYSAEFDGTSVPHLSNYFTILYGLYPLNFMDYIRKPQRYLRHAKTNEEVEVQPTEIRDRSERFRRCHLVHPNFYSLTIESEIADFGRWIKSEPAEVVADCMALCLPFEMSTDYSAIAPANPVVPDTVEGGEAEKDVTDPVPDSALLSGSLTEAAAAGGSLIASLRHSSSTTVESSAASFDRRLSGRARKNSQSSHPSLVASLESKPREVGGDSPTLPTQFGAAGSQTQLQDMIQSNKVIKSSINQSLTNDSVPSLALSHQESIQEKGSVKMPLVHQSMASAVSLIETSPQVSQLYRQLLLLQNDLNFERYMKQQHLAHIGELRRKQVREAATEAETQNLIMANRQLKHRLEEAKRSEMQAKKEAENRRTMSKKWDADLAAKLRVLRDEQKAWTTEGASLRRDLEAAKDECERLRKLVAEAEDKDLKSKQHAQSIEININEIERLKTEVERLTAAERGYQGKELAMVAAMNQAAEAGSRAESLSLELKAREAELERTKNTYQSQIVVLSAKLDEALQNGKAKGENDVNVMVEGALEASRARQAELQKQYSQLMRRFTVLQSSMLEQSCANSTPQSRPNDNLSTSVEEGDTEGTTLLTGGSPVGTPISNRTRSNRGFSDPELFEPTSFNVTPPLENISSSLSTMLQRPSTPSGSAGTDPLAGGKMSPPGDRYYGRGGVQNTIRKEKKDKKSDSEKKDKKGTIRSIRGFV